MPSATLFAVALAAAARLALGQSNTCSGDIKITTLKQSFSCDTIDGNLIVDPSLSGTLAIEGPEEITKDLIILNATHLMGVSSSTITTIGGTMQLESLQFLSTLSMDSLTSVNTLKLAHLPQLGTLNFGSKTGVTKSSSISIDDTFLNDLSGLNIATADTITITGNNKLAKFNSDLVNVTDLLQVTFNGNNMQVNMSSLKNAGKLQFRQVKSFDAPVLESAGAIYFNESPELESVSANNLSQIEHTLSFINNTILTNLSFNALTKVSGDMTIQNNTNLKAIDGFPKLGTVGSILLAGSFEKVKLPNLKDVKGSVTVTSTTDIRNFCKFFDDAKSRGDIQGKESCTSNNKDANSTPRNSTSQSTDNNKNAAGTLSVNMAALALLMAAALVQLL